MRIFGAMAPMSSLTTNVYQSIRADILACRIPPGERIRINNKCDELGVSLGAVREALSRLTSEGLVVSEPQRGFKAAPISVQELLDLTEVRSEIEVMCLRRAFAAGGVEWESRLLAAEHRLSRTPMHAPGESQSVSDEWAAVHTEFHEALVSACDSPTLLQIRSQLYAKAERYRRLSVPLSRRDRDLVGEHEALTTAVLNHDVEAAVETIQMHIRETTQRLIAGLNNESALKTRSVRAVRSHALKVSGAR